MDEEKRSEYDEFGEVDADGLSGLSGKSFDELYKHFRAMHAAVTEADLDEWAEKYLVLVLFLKIAYLKLL